MKKRLFFCLAAVATISVNVFADEGTLRNEQTVCQSSKYEYEVNPLTAGASYEWDFNGMGTANTDYKLTDTESTHYKIQIEWLTETSTGRTMKSREKSGEGCIGPWKETTVIVAPKPEVTDKESTLCSTGQGTSSISTATTDDVYGQDLTVTDENGFTITKWDLAYESALPSGVTMTGATIPATGVIDKTVLNNMKFSNTTSATQDVVISVTPYIGDCVGDPYKITIHVLPEVKEHTVKYRSL